MFMIVKNSSNGLFKVIDEYSMGRAEFFETYVFYKFKAKNYDVELKKGI